MRFTSAMLALFLCGPVFAEDTAGPKLAPSGIQQHASTNKSTAPAQPAPVPHTVIQGQADYATCIDNVTGATAIALTSLGVATTHVPAGGVAGLLIGAGSGRFLVGPRVCAPDQAP
jgi:hypothetical protein